MTEVTVTMLPAAPLYALEIWSNPAAVGQRFDQALGFALPSIGLSDGNDTLRLIRYEPTVWLVEGDASALPNILADNGALTAIGGGIVRVRLSGKGWRTLLMEGGIFDAESQHFIANCSAATVIDHVAVRLHVVNETTCNAYVPLSYSEGLVHFWEAAAGRLEF